MSVEVTVLSNGLTVATDRMEHVGTASVSVTFGAGSRSEAESEHGLAHLLEHMAFKGTTRRTALRIAEEIEEVGGDLNAATGVEQTSYDARVLAGDVPLALDILSDILTSPLFPEDELEREKGVILQEIGAVEDTPDDLVYDLAQSAAFAGQAIGRPILGTPESVGSLDRAAISGFLGRHYQAGRAIVAAAGDVRHSDVVALAQDHLGGLANGGGEGTSQARWSGGEMRDVRDLEQAHIVMAFPGLALSHDDTIALQVYANLLGGGMSSRLFQEVREKRGLVYTIQAFHWSFADTGMLGVYAGTGEDDIRELMPVMMDEMADAAHTASEREIARAKAQMRMSLELAREQPVARAERLSRQILTLGRVVTAEEILARLEAVTVEDVRRAALASLSGPPALAAIGPVRPLPQLDRLTGRLGARPAAA
ncbi:pitrilysin family protein [Terrihabitans rhizophilus]|uniref:Pitrilysin family protein n=1 Tax=Terrihabitans rhizophilus TaxID=3092662 RepID=A0ABU4RR42_9HYPH|nr:pitrilysin family protein [Terrihabitans sp. PJ23]MDX6807319.1 pitrilysin family protein [Terrihabitans sp. PJ23]